MEHDRTGRLGWIDCFITPVAAVVVWMALLVWTARDAEPWRKDV